MHYSSPLIIVDDVVVALDKGSGRPRRFPLGRHRWNSAVRRIYNQGRPWVRLYSVLPGAKPIGRRVVVDGIGVEQFVAVVLLIPITRLKGSLHACLESRFHFLIRQKLSISVLGRAFHRREA